MSNEEVTELQEELAEARAELEQVQLAAADREARAAHLEQQLAGLREELSGARSEVEERDRRLTELDERSQALETQLRAAADRYRELALERSPELPEELVTGETVEAVDAALERARETVAKVRGHLETEAQAGRVPVGAPARSGPDLSGMSAEQKIEYGLQRSRA